MNVKIVSVHVSEITNERTDTADVFNLDELGSISFVLTSKSIEAIAISACLVNRTRYQVFSRFCNLLLNVLNFP
jgi:hypothetical protein